METIANEYQEELKAVTHKFHERFMNARDHLFAASSLSQVDRLKIYTSILFQVVIDAANMVGKDNTLSLVALVQEQLKAANVN